MNNQIRDSATTIFENKEKSWAPVSTTALRNRASDIRNNVYNAPEYRTLEVNRKRTVLYVKIHIN